MLCAANVDTHEADGNVLSETAEVTGHNGGDIKLIVVLICALAGIALAVIWMAGGRKRPFLLVAALICAVAGVAATFLEFSTPEEYYSQSAVQGISVTVTVDCSAAIENADKAADGIAVPLSPEIIAKRTVTVTDGSSALDALVEAAR